MNALERVLQDDLNRLVDRLAAVTANARSIDRPFKPSSTGRRRGSRASARSWLGAMRRA